MNRPVIDSTVRSKGSEKHVHHIDAAVADSEPGTSKRRRNVVYIIPSAENAQLKTNDFPSGPWNSHIPEPFI
jgi:hypothetical protein